MLQLNLKFISLLNYNNICISNASNIVKCSLAEKNLTIVNTINAHSYIVQKTNKELKNALMNSHLLIPDGIGIVWASKILNNKKIQKITGYDFFIETMKQIDSSNKSVFFLGSSDHVLSRIKIKIDKEYPNVKHNYFSPPFKEKFSEKEINEFITLINNLNPDVVFVGLTAPKQEILINSINKNIHANLISGIGAVFDFYAETIRRPNKFFIFFHLEWLGRFLKNPFKMFDRVFISMPLFLIDVIKNIILRDK